MTLSVCLPGLAAKQNNKLTVEKKLCKESKIISNAAHVSESESHRQFYSLRIGRAGLKLLYIALY